MNSLPFKNYMLFSQLYLKPLSFKNLMADCVIIISGRRKHFRFAESFHYGLDLSALRYKDSCGPSRAFYRWLDPEGPTAKCVVRREGQVEEEVGPSFPASSFHSLHDMGRFLLARPWHRTFLPANYGLKAWAPINVCFELWVSVSCPGSESDRDSSPEVWGSFVLLH